MLQNNFAKEINRTRSDEEKKRQKWLANYTSSSPATARVPWVRRSALRRRKRLRLRCDKCDKSMSKKHNSTPRHTRRVSISVMEAMVSDETHGGYLRFARLWDGLGVLVDCQFRLQLRTLRSQAHIDCHIKIQELTQRNNHASRGDLHPFGFFVRLPRT